MKIPSHLQDNGMSNFLKTLCSSCKACSNLITLDPGPEQCETCAHKLLKRSIKSDSSDSPQPCGMKRERLSPTPLEKQLPTPPPETAVPQQTLLPPLASPKTPAFNNLHNNTINHKTNTVSPSVISSNEAGRFKINFPKKGITF